MNKKPRGQIWDVNASWEANIHAVLDAAAARRVPSAAVRAKQRKARLAWWARKRKARRLKMEAHRAQQVARTFEPYGRRPVDLILLAMRPGAWHSMPEIKATSGMPKHNVSPNMPKLYARGLVEKAHNADRPQGVVCTIPKFLYRLTAAGEAERAVLELC